MLQSEKDIKQYALRKLGFGVVDIELTDAMLSDCIVDAKRWFATYIGQLKETTITIAPSGGAFSVPDDVEFVTNVVFQDMHDFEDYFDWADIDLSPLAFGGSFGVGPNSAMSTDYSYILQLRQYFEMGKRIIGTDQDWEFNRETRKIEVYPSRGVVDHGTIAVIKYLTNDPDVALMNLYEYDMVRKWAYAEAMEYLGNIRTKFAEWPSSTGSVALNGDTLLANADSLKSALTDKVRALRKPVGFFAF